MAASRDDWGGIQERLLAGERPAVLQLQRLVSSVLAQLRAYDFEQEWDDLRQEVAMAVIANRLLDDMGRRTGRF